MNRRTLLRSGAFLLAAGALFAGSGFGIASAHEHRTVGDYEFVVGFNNEPAVQDELNAVDLRISLATPADATPAADDDDEAAATPVEGLEDSLSVEVIFGDQKVTLPLEARWNQPGAYVAYFIPTQAGDYSFHITGEIDGQAVDETFTSGPESFSAVAPRSDLEFPKAS